MSARAGGRRSIRVPAYDYAAAGAYHVTLCTQGKACVMGEIVDEAVILSDAGQMVESWWCTIPGRFPGVELDAYVVMPNHLHGVLRFTRLEGGVTPVTAAPTGWADTEVRTLPGAVPGRGRLPCLPTRPGATIAGAGAPPGADARADWADTEVRTLPGEHGSSDGRGGPPCPPTHPETGPGIGERPTLGAVVQWFKSITTWDYGVGVERFGWAPYPGRLWQRNYFERIVRDEAELERIRAYIAANPARWREDDEYRADTSAWGSRR